MSKWVRWDKSEQYKTLHMYTCIYHVYINIICAIIMYIYIYVWYHMYTHVVHTQLKVKKAETSKETTIEEVKVTVMVKWRISKPDTL